MPRAHSAIEAIDREAQALVEKIKRAEERDQRFTAKVNELTLVMRQNQALIDDLQDRLDRLDQARTQLTPAAVPEEISLAAEPD